MAMRWSVVVAAFGVGLAASAGAMAAGGPVPPVQGNEGIGIAGSPVRFVVTPAEGDTLVRRVTAGLRRVQPTLRVSGRYGIPGADFNGSTTGLSADGRTLVLEQLHPYTRVRTTRLLVLDTRPLRIRKKILLTGWSTVDAISPNGGWLYLIHYPSSSDLSSYEVQAYDLRNGRLIA